MLLQAGSAHPFTATRHRSGKSATGRTGTAHVHSDVFPYAAIFAILVSMTDDQFSTLVWYLRAIVLLLAIVAVITFAYGGLPE
jgi:hypothetical protein